jgi:predicted GTPase
MAALIEPFVDPRLRHIATVRRAKDLDPHTDIVIPRSGFHSGIYLETSVTAAARAALAARDKAVVIIGRPKSGKTRLVWQLLQERQDALVVIPEGGSLPGAIDVSTFVGQDVVLFFDNMQARRFSATHWRGADVCRKQRAVPVR